MGEGKRISSLIAWNSTWDMLLVPSLNGLMSIPTRNGLTMRSNGLVSSSDSENGARDRQGSKTGPCRAAAVLARKVRDFSASSNANHG